MNTSQIPPITVGSVIKQHLARIHALPQAAKIETNTAAPARIKMPESQPPIYGQAIGRVPSGVRLVTVPKQ